MKNKGTMLDYAKRILKAVHFDRKLFKKEYQKSLTWINPNEANELKVWVNEEFRSAKKK